MTTGMVQPNGTPHADFHAAIDRFILGSDNGTGEVRQWFSAFLKRVDWAALNNPSLGGYSSTEPRTLPPRTQIDLLKLCVAAMVHLRADRWQHREDSRDFNSQSNEPPINPLATHAANPLSWPKRRAMRKVAGVRESKRQGTRS